MFVGKEQMGNKSVDLRRLWALGTLFALNPTAFPIPYRKALRTTVAKMISLMCENRFNLFLVNA